MHHTLSLLGTSRMQSICQLLSQQDIQQCFHEDVLHRVRHCLYRCSQHNPYTTRRQVDLASGCHRLQLVRLSALVQWSTSVRYPSSYRYAPVVVNMDSNKKKRSRVTGKSMNKQRWQYILYLFPSSEETSAYAPPYIRSVLIPGPPCVFD